LRLILENGSWVLIRPSGTEPVFRIYVETGKDECLTAIQKEVLQGLGISA